MSSDRNGDGLSRPGPARLHAVPGLVFQWGLLLAPPLAVLTPLALAPLAVVMAVALAVAHVHARQSLAFLPLDAVIVSAAIVVWAGLTFLWTTGPDETLRLWPRLVADLAGGIFLVAAATRLTESQQERVGRFFLGGMAIAVVLLIVEGLTHGSLHTALRSTAGETGFRFMSTLLNRATALLAIMVWPAAIIVYRRFGGAAGVATVAGLLAVVAFFSSDKSIFGVVAGGAIFAFAYCLPRRAPQIIAGAIAIAILVSPIVAKLPLRAVPLDTHENMSGSVSHRFIIWDFTSERIGERPLSGWGLNTSRAIPGGKDLARPGTEFLPLHPHSAPLQWWLELGAVGAALFALLAAIGILSLGRRFVEPVERAFALGMAGCVMTIASVGYGIWQGWWVAALLAVVFGSRRDQPARAGGKRIGTGLNVVVLNGGGI